MCIKAMIGLAAAIVLVAAATVPAIGASSKVRAARSAPTSIAASQIPPPAYGYRKDGHAHSSNPAHDVYVNGRYSGSDPDPRIRAELHRNPPWGAER